jgi:uncharacterized membrane protein
LDLTHIHLLLNHFPTVGTIIGIGLFVVSLLGKASELKQASLAVLLGIALLTLPTYITGNAAQAKICGWDPILYNPNDACKAAGVPNPTIQAHEGAALVSLALMEITGAFAWLGLWQLRRSSRLPRWNASVILLLSLVTLGLVVKAANLGGEIRHPEIRDAQAAAAGTPLAREVGTFVLMERWVWPTCETLHFIGLSLLFGVAALIDLRILGMMKGLPFPALHRLLPWGILGFGINAITGMLFFVGEPQQYTGNAAFQWKIILMMLAGINVLYFTVFDEAWAVGAGDDAPFTAKAVAASALVLVLGVLYCGRMLPFLGNAF